MQDLFNYFVKRSDSLDENEVPTSITGRLKKLNRPDREELKTLLIEKGKQLEASGHRHLISWLEICITLINENAFHFNRVFFSPGNQIKNEIKQLLDHATESVDLCIFTITDYELAKKIKSCHKRGVNVRIITDDEKVEDNGSEITQLAKAGIPVKTDHSHYHMHNKFGIIDGQIAITGSFNWTYTATKHNQENLVATTKFEIVKQYNEEFNRLWGQLFKLEEPA
ncbi:phospholipase D-like domain-containing protein [Draconibacterium sp. IB214405]|uniref:phospholipase D-like domain-containing protein n=1 Tax=Draconibacterium sp. IB214405 TaxID=3097352 RepID=UPI002A0ED00C|nr:phospholipase D-like domain-containing protein [Draconibacterium sp. IB214405]MDX8340010.1 phospholipase D-like domain-containing protein [Draconibacterium sp. IB214405]